MKAKFYRRKDTKAERYVVYLDWKGRRHSRTWEDDGAPIESERRAFRLCERINGAIENHHKHFDPRFWFNSRSQMRFDNYARAWLERQIYRDKPYAPGTWGNVVRSINKATRYFKGMDIREIRAGHLEDYQHHLENGQREAFLYLHKLFSDGYRREDIKHIPPFPKLQSRKPRIRWITREWQDLIIEVIQPKNRPIFEFMKVTGVRKSEARALMWDCVDWEKKLVSIRRTFSGDGSGARNLKEPKTGWERDLPLTDELLKILKPLRGLGGYVFRNSGGRPYNRSILGQIWSKARDSVGCPDKVTINQAFRSSKASQLAMKGENPWAIARLLGHTDIKTTQKYTSVNTDGIKGMVE